jgi:GDPmannose 4,6-dehydratase
MRALIIGVTGQDGSYLAEQLAAQGHTVYGMLRGQVHPKREWLQKLVPNINFVYGDLLDLSSLCNVIKEANPDVVFNLGAVTFVGMSWHQPTVISEITGLGCMRVLEAIRIVNPEIRFVQASSSEMFGDVFESPQNESTPFNPVSSYGVAKVYAHHTTVTYRNSFGIHASNVMMFNHESVRRGEEFVTRKVTAAVARIAAGEQDKVSLGRLTPARDWGWAPDYMKALPLIAMRDTPDDFVLATGETHTVSEWCEAAFKVVGIDNWLDYIAADSSLLRPSEVWTLTGNASKARDKLGWAPVVPFDESVRRMVECDMQLGKESPEVRFIARNGW